MLRTSGRGWAKPTLEGAGEPQVELVSLSDDEVAAAVGVDIPTEEELQAEYERLREIDPPAEELYPELWLIPILKLRGAAARIFSRTEEKRENLLKQLVSEEEVVTPSFNNPESFRGVDPKKVEKLADKALRDNGWTKGSLKRGDGVRYYDGKGGSFEINKGYEGGKRLHRGPYIKITIGSEKVRIPLLGNPDL